MMHGTMNMKELPNIKLYENVFRDSRVSQLQERHTGGQTELQPITIKASQSCESGLKAKHEVEVTKTLSETFRQEMF
jgi:hypothetical protein